MLWKMVFGCSVLLTGNMGFLQSLQAQNPSVRASIMADSLLYLDQDMDGVVNKYDVCMELPGPAENDGCPERVAVVAGMYSTGIYGRYLPYADYDQDGLPNSWDECPEQMGLRTLKGCPAPHNTNARKAEFPISVIQKSDIVLALSTEALSARFEHQKNPALDSLITIWIRQPHTHIVLISESRNQAVLNRLKAYLQIRGLAGRRILIRSKREIRFVENFVPDVQDRILVGVL